MRATQSQIIRSAPRAPHGDTHYPCRCITIARIRVRSLAYEATSWPEVMWIVVDRRGHFFADWLPNVTVFTSIGAGTPPMAMIGFLAVHRRWR